MRIPFPNFPTPLDFIEQVVQDVGVFPPVTLNVTDWEWWFPVAVTCQYNIVGATTVNPFVRIITPSLGTYVASGAITITGPGLIVFTFAAGASPTQQSEQQFSSPMPFIPVTGNGSLRIDFQGATPGDTVAKVVMMIAGKRAGSPPLSIPWLTATS